MRSDRLWRALITGLTLLACLWILGHIGSGRVRTAVIPVPPAETREYHAPAQPDTTAIGLLPVVPVPGFPWAAMDNTCEAARPKDISVCTGFLSGGAVREYDLTITNAPRLSVRVEPQSEFFDVSFALLAPEGGCLAGKDEHGAGIAEDIELSGLKSGDYRLLVSGYGEDCGPYLLTLQDEIRAAGEITGSRVCFGRNGAAVRWESFAEAGLSHYLLFRVESKGKTQIATLRSHGSPAGKSVYHFLDRTPERALCYQIESVARDGRTETVNLPM